MSTSKQNARQLAKRIIARNKRLGDLLASHLERELLQVEPRTLENISERTRTILNEMPTELKELCDYLAKSGED